MLTKTHHSEFFEQGYTRVSGAVQNEYIAEASAGVWSVLSQNGIYETQPETWREPKPKGLQSVAKNSSYDLVFGEPAKKSIDALLGGGRWEPPKHWGQLILSLPVDYDWVVPNKAWHLDLPQKVEDIDLPGIQIFVCLEDIEQSCGATVVATGTHRLVAKEIIANGLPDEGSSSALRKRISKNCEWFRQLVGNNPIEFRNDKFMKQPHVEGDVLLQVRELIGKKGDMILMHPYLFHAPAPNIGPAIRMAVTQRIYVI